MLVYTLIHILKKAVAQKPHQIAFKFLEQTLTFFQLDARSNQLAKHLLDKGLKKGDRVGIYMPRSLESVVAVYGILKAGGAYVPLDPFSPTLRTEFVIKDCGIQHIISVNQQKRKLKKVLENQKDVSIVGIEKEIVNIDCTSWQDIFNLDAKNDIYVNVLGDDLAYIIYTSGSTGTPKGIMHTHNSALAFVRLVSDLYTMDNCIYGMHAPLHFDPSIQGVFAAPYALATTIIVSDAHTKMPSSLAALIEKEKITTWLSVPLALIQMLSHGNLEKRDMTSLKWVLFSGEVFPTRHLKDLMEKWSFAKFSNIYGPTETNQCTYYHVEKLPDNTATIPIGYVWGNTEFKILDTKDVEVAKGEIGELVVRTATMMKGYWNNKTLTQQSFFRDETIVGATRCFYRTGDQVKLDEDERLLFLGRNDHQVKIRGYRIELEEINNVFTANDNVEEAISFAVTKELEEEKIIITAILPKVDTVIDIEALQLYSKSKLPHYAVPDLIKVYKEFPRTASGKIDRKALEKTVK